VFFVLSGYLITSILLNELQRSGGISLSNFYMRRILRLTPALAVLVLFQLVRSAFSEDRREILEATLVGATYLENWNSVFYFAPFDLMGHTWSLAVEEQFYWLWPFTLLFLVRNKPLVWISAGLAAMVITRMVLWNAGYSTSTLNYSLGIRPVGLLIGCIIALLPIDRWQPHPLVASIFLAALVGIAFFADSSPYAFLAAPLAASTATALLIICLQYKGPIFALMASPLLVYTGEISYGLYLYHWPIFILGESFKIQTPFHLYALGLVVVIFIAAALSYEFVEKPFLRLKEKFQQRPATQQFAERYAP